MSKTITITSRHKYLTDTPANIIAGTYKWTLAQYGVTILLEEIKEYNDANIKKIIPTVKYIREEKAKIRLKGNNQTIQQIIFGLCRKSNFGEHFEIKI